MAPSRTRKLSCKRCQFRKLKCSRTDPCHSCVASKHPCEYREQDSKRRPATHEYVAGLENRIAWLESYIKSVKAASFDDRERLLAAVDLDDHLSPNHTAIVTARSTAGVGETLRDRNDVRDDLTRGPPAYHGTTSIYAIQHDGQDHRPTSAGASSSSPSTPDAESSHDYGHVAEHFGINMNDELVTAALLQFFKWQYPHFMFVYREAFLREHFGDHKKCKYWSSALLLSICALGSLMFVDGEQREISERFFNAAESIIVVSGLGRPCVTTVQAYLCLAIYEIGRGNLSKGWGYSGIAFRMAQDLGFQKDPKHWVSHDASLATPEDVEIRRRIYWGCYTFDKIISLILGRPIYLYHDDAEVEHMERLPDLPGMEPWLPAGFADHEKFRGVHPLVPCFSEQIRLSRTIERMLTTLFAPRSTMDGLSRRAHLDSLHLEFFRWQELLPDCTKWNKWEPSSDSLMPSVAALHVLFHSSRIVLHFNQTTSHNPTAVEESAKSACISSAQDIISLVRKYRSWYGLQYIPVIFIYGIAQAARVAKAFGIAAELQFLLQALEECSLTWVLARWLKEHILQTAT